ncbi:MAG: hypothetical protein R2867_28425 [Caldilineaceae bacterium]
MRQHGRSFSPDEPNSTEFDISTEYPIIDLMPDQRDIADMGGTMRLGTYPCQLDPESKAGQAYLRQGHGQIVLERHRHRFEFNNAYRKALEEQGVRFSGLSPDGRLVEIAELRDHPFMMGSQFHPEFKSRPNRPHPLFLAFVEAVEAHAHHTDSTLTVDDMADQVTLGNGQANGEAKENVAALVTKLPTAMQ